MAEVRSLILTKRVVMRLLLVCAFLSFICCTPPKKLPSSLTLEQRYAEDKLYYQKTEAKIKYGTIQFNGGNGFSKDSAIVIGGLKNYREANTSATIYINNKYGQQNIDWKEITRNISIKNHKMIELIIFQDINANSNVLMYFDFSSAIPDTSQSPTVPR
jgi:hypothetical protein